MMDEKMIEVALKKAYILGQTYWQQADSESYAQNRKSDETQARFDALVSETVDLLREAVQHEKHECCGNPAQCWEPCGQLGKSEAHTAVAPDEELP